MANSCTLVAKVIGKAIRDGKPSYYINDGIYHTYSGQIFDHYLSGAGISGGGDTGFGRVRPDL